MLKFLIGLQIILSVEAKNLKLDGGGKSYEVCSYSEGQDCLIKVKSRAEYDAQRDTENLCSEAKGRLMYESLRNVAKCTPSSIPPWMPTLIVCEAKSYANCELQEPEQIK
jgi:hypothetical protein